MARESVCSSVHATKTSSPYTLPLVAVGSTSYTLDVVGSREIEDGRGLAVPDPIKLKPDGEGTDRVDGLGARVLQNASRLGRPFLRTPAPTTSSGQWKSAAGASPVAGIGTMVLFTSQILALSRPRAYYIFPIECILPPLHVHLPLTVRHYHLHHRFGSRTCARVSNLISLHFQVRAHNQNTLRKHPSPTDLLLTSKITAANLFLQKGPALQNQFRLRLQSRPLGTLAFSHSITCPVHRS